MDYNDMLALLEYLMGGRMGDVGSLGIDGLTDENASFLADENADVEAMAREMLRDPLTKQALADFRPAGMKQKLIAQRLAQEDASFLLATAAAADLSQQKTVGLFKKYIRK